MRRRSLFIVFFIVSAIAGIAQKTAFTVTADKQRIVIGEPFNLTLEATIAKKKSESWVQVDTFPYFEILETGKLDTLQEGAFVVLHQTIKVTSWDSGGWQVPAFTFAGIRSKPITVTVAFTPFNPAQDYHDIKEIIEVEKPPRTVWYWYVALGLLLLGLASLMFPSKKRQPPSETIMDETVFKKTLLQLESLQMQIETQESKAYYTALIDIFRNYLNKRKGIQSTSQTTDGLLVALAKLNLKEEPALRQTLAESDMVKFAKLQPDNDQKQTAWQTIRKTIIDIEKV
ncbi:MAG: hypothetical protein JWP88_587 [Flaviaesturariibacter sp.]|nr:hypothetical protein [Flaviaesturariibacter sp.]